MQGFGATYMVGLDFTCMICAYVVFGVYKTLGISSEIPAVDGLCWLARHITKEPISLICRGLFLVWVSGFS